MQRSLFSWPGLPGNEPEPPAVMASPSSRDPSPAGAGVNPQGTLREGEATGGCKLGRWGRGHHTRLTCHPQGLPSLLWTRPSPGGAAQYEEG